MKDLNQKQIKNRAEQLFRKRESEMEELWDWICSEIGFTRKGYQIQSGIKKFIKLRGKVKIR